MVFFLAGLTVVVIGAVQFKEEAGLAQLRYHFVVAGLVLLLLGSGLAVVKWVWFRTAYPVYYGDLDEATMLGALKKSENGSPKNGEAKKSPHLDQTPKNGGSPKVNKKECTSQIVAKRFWSLFKLYFIIVNIFFLYFPGSREIPGKGISESRNSGKLKKHTSRETLFTDLRLIRVSSKRIF